MKTIFKILLLCPPSRQAVPDTRDRGQKLTFKFPCMWLGSAVLSEALPVTHYGRRGRNCTHLYLLELGMPPFDGVKRDITLSIYSYESSLHHGNATIISKRIMLNEFPRYIYSISSPLNFFSFLIMEFISWENIIQDGEKKEVSP